MIALTDTKERETALERGVPAVRHTIAIFEYLRDRGNEPASMTQIAHALGMNPSTCFNILKTLEQGDLLHFDADTKHYELGTGLSDLGAAVSEEGAVLTSARMKALDFVRRYKLIMLICQKAEDDSFIVIDKMRGRPDLRGTAPLGGKVPPNGAVLAKAYYAHQPDEVVDEMLELHGLPSRTPMSITTVAKFKNELAEVKERGYSVSIGEYEVDYNAVGAPILSPAGNPVLLMVVTGHSSFMPERLIPAIGERLGEAVDDISRAVFHLEGASKAHLDRLHSDANGVEKPNQKQTPKPSS
ncbi:MAG TPA: IclR family transcriptional regulator [Solirubrobacterales bacterium]|nr:IclR family transcriptional regulator [Solirubrobacterales bacterium]